MDLAIAAGQNDSLISQLSFQLPAVATYARERRLVQVVPQGANTFAPNGNQVMTFNLTNNGEGWLDPSSLRLSTDFSARWSDLALRLQIAAKERSAQGAEACCLPIAGGVGAIGCLRMHVHFVVLQLKRLVQESPLLHSLQCLACLANAHANEHSCRLHRALGACSPCDAEAIGCTCISFSLQTTWREHVFFFFFFFF